MPMSASVKAARERKKRIQSISFVGGIVLAASAIVGASLLEYWLFSDFHPSVRVAGIVAAWIVAGLIFAKAFSRIGGKV